jgi:hypothetical protein
MYFSKMGLKELYIHYWIEKVWHVHRQKQTIPLKTNNHTF